MARGHQQEDPRITEAELKALAAQTGQVQSETALNAQRQQALMEELALRRAAEERAGTESRFKIGQEQEMTPFQKLLALSKAGEPEQADRANRIKTAVDLLQLRDAAKTREATLQAHEATTKSNLQESLVSHLAQRGDVPLSTIADTLRRGGNPELADSLDAAHAADVTRKVEANRAVLPQLQKAGQLEKALPSMQADPEVWSQLKPHVDALTTAPTEAQAPLGFKLGNLVRNVPELVVPGGPMVTQPFRLANMAANALPNISFKDILAGLQGQKPVKKQTQPEE